MARPHRDPKSGVYYFRMRVPQVWLPYVQGRMMRLPVGDEVIPVKIAGTVKLSLRTRDPDVARQRFRAVSDSFSAQCRSIQDGPMPLTTKQIYAVAGIVYRDKAEEMAENADPEFWSLAIEVYEQWIRSGQYEQRFGVVVDDALARLGLVVSPESRPALLKAVAEAVVDQARLMLKRGSGDFSPDVQASRYPDAASVLVPLKTSSVPKAQSGADVSTPTHIDQVWKRYSTTPPIPRSSTLRRWAPAIAAFQLFTEGRAMADIVSADAYRFVDHRVSSGISPRSAESVDLAAVKRMFSFAHTRGWIPTNPLAGLRRERRTLKVVSDRDGKDFRTDEWKTILSNASRIYENPGKRGVALQNAIRWVPWICAYCGARPGEIIQLRKEDFVMEGEIPTYWIRDSAGTVKTGESRQTPLHEHLVAQGLLEFVHRSGPGHLFISPDASSKDSIRSAVDTTRGRLSEWVRSIGVTDREISPNHAWRHTFKTIAREAGIDTLIQEAICGHTPRAQGEKYGRVTVVTKFSALKKFPRYDVS